MQLTRARRRRRRVEMGHRCCSKQKVKRGLWSPEEDDKLVKHITTYGHGSWSSVPKLAGLQRCGKSCRLRWINYLRPDLKRGSFSAQEEQIIIDVHRILGNRWAQIAKHLPGRTDNEVKNFWNSCIKKKLISQGLDPKTHNLIPSHQRSNINKVISNNFPKSHQQPFSIISINSRITDTTSMEMINPPVETLPHSMQPSSSVLPTYQNPNSNDAILFPSSSSSPANPCAGFGLLDENSLWCNDYNHTIMEPFEASRMEVEQQQITHNASIEAAFDNSGFGLELVESALFSTPVSCHELNSMDDLAWNF